MEVVIKITENSYSKIIVMNDGKELVEKWERFNNGFRQTKESIRFEDLDLLPETLDALDSSFNFSEISDALENQNAEVYDEDEYPMTTDGHKLQRGDTFFTVASTIRNKKIQSVPLKLRFPLDWDSCGSETYISIQKCEEVCNQRNLSE